MWILTGAQLHALSSFESIGPWYYSMMSLCATSRSGWLLGRWEGGWFILHSQYGAWFPYLLQARRSARLWIQVWRSRQTVCCRKERSVQLSHKIIDIFLTVFYHLLLRQTVWRLSSWIWNVLWPPLLPKELQLFWDILVRRHLYCHSPPVSGRTLLWLPSAQWAQRSHFLCSGW